MADRLRPSERRAAPRTAVVWDVLDPVLAEGGRVLDVVDIGGGTGGSAVRIAALGHRVSVVDPSPDALAALDRRAHEQDVADRITGHQGDLADLADLVPDGTADLVLCHGVLEIVRDPAAALSVLRSALADDGLLSLLVAQRHAAVLGRAVAGHFSQALALLDGSDGTVVADGVDRSDGRSAVRRFAVDEVRTMLEGEFSVRSVHGIRVFADLVPGSVLEVEAGATEALLRLERAVADRPEYHSVAAQLHVLADPR